MENEAGLLGGNRNIFLYCNHYSYNVFTLVPLSILCTIIKIILQKKKLKFESQFDLKPKWDVPKSESAIEHMIFRLKCRTKIENNETERRPNRVKINKHITQKEKNPIFWTKMKFLRKKSQKCSKNSPKICSFFQHLMVFSYEFRNEKMLQFGRKRCKNDWIKWIE